MIGRAANARLMSRRCPDGTGVGINADILRGVHPVAIMARHGIYSRTLARLLAELAGISVSEWQLPPARTATELFPLFAASLEATRG